MMRSPLPWKGDNNYITDASGRVIARLNIIGLTAAEVEGDIATIVKAVNHHDELVAALKAYREMLNDHFDRVSDPAAYGYVIEDVNHPYHDDHKTFQRLEKLLTGQHHE
jgi:hypothetical protein